MKGEAQLQSECVRWFRLQYPNLLLFAIPNGGSRNVIEAANLKKQGVMAGIPDLFLAFPRAAAHGLFIEMKFGKNKLTPNQKEVFILLQNQGYSIATCYSFDQFQTIINFYITQTPCTQF